MSRNEYLQREIIYSSIFVLIGIAALISFIIGFEKQVMSGLAIGFIPTGVGMLVIYQLGKKLLLVRLYCLCIFQSLERVDSDVFDFHVGIHVYSIFSSNCNIS